MFGIPPCSLDQQNKQYCTKVLKKYEIMKNKRSMNMFNLLLQRETGRDDPRKLAELEKTKRVCSLQLSPVKTFEQVHSGGINSLSISPESQYGRLYLLSAASRGTIAIHNLSTRCGEACKVVAKIDKESKFMHKMNVETVSWYPHDSGLFISSSVDGIVKIWDTNVLQSVEDFVLQDMVYHHQMSPIATSHSLVAVACRDSRVYLVDLQSGSALQILKGHRKAVLSLAWSTRDPFLLASGSSDNKVLLWDIRNASGAILALDQHNGKQSSEFLKSKTAHNGHVNSLAFTSNGLNLVSYGTDDRVRLWDVTTGQNMLVNYGRIPNPYNKGIEIAVSDTSQELAFLPSNQYITVVDIHTGKHVMKLKGAYHNVNCCTYEENFQELYTGSNDTFILAWQPERRAVADLEISADDGDPRTQPGPSVYQDAWSSDEDD